MEACPPLYFQPDRKKRPGINFEYSKDAGLVPNMPKSLTEINCTQLRWKQFSPRAAAWLHLDRSLTESQACSPHCPDSYLCNCLPVREEHKWSWQQHCLPPTQRQETCSNGDSGVLGPLVHCQERHGRHFVGLTCTRDPNVGSRGYRWKFEASGGNAGLLACHRVRYYRFKAQEQGPGVLQQWDIRLVSTQAGLRPNRGPGPREKLS